MEFLANDLSIHGQFYAIASFREAFGRLMDMRAVARRFGRDVHCNRTLLAVEAMPGVRMQQALQHLTESERRSAMSWLTRGGPFWDELRQHGADDWLECQGEVVTDSAVGEAAYRMLHAVACGLVSAVPSNWNFSPVTVVWRRENGAGEDRLTQLDNFQNSHVLEEALRNAPPSTQSWDDILKISMTRFANLTFADNCVEPLEGVPFARSTAERIIMLLDILDRFARSFDATGIRTSEGQRIWQDYFTGGNALFSDSSDKEKRDFRKELIFPNPNDPRESLFCTWHGKVRHMTLRLHYSWSGQANKPVYVVYIGPKITRR